MIFLSRQEGRNMQLTKNSSNLDLSFSSADAAPFPHVCLVLFFTAFIYVKYKVL